MDRDLTDFILVGHGYAGTIISKVVEVIPERVRRLVFWSAYVLNDGETALEMLPDSIEMLTQMAADSADNTFMIPFEMWRDVFINDGDPDLVQRAYGQLSPEPFGPWAEPLKMKKFHSLQIPRSFLVGTADMVMPPGDSGWIPACQAGSERSGWSRCREATRRSLRTQSTSLTSSSKPDATRARRSRSTG